MASKRELVNRWKSDLGVGILKQIYELGVSLHDSRHGRSSREILAMLDGLPFRYEVANGGDLRSASLDGGVSNMDFSGWDFSYAHGYMNLIECDLRGANFEGAKMKSNLSSGRLDSANFRGANLRGSFVAYTVAHKCCFDDAVIANVSFEGADLTGSSFKNADCSGANFLKANLIACDFRSARLDQAILKEVKLDKSTDLRGASLFNLWNEDQRDRTGKLVYRGTDWRQASYDETTRHGVDPSAIALETIDNALVALGGRSSPEAMVLFQRFRELRRKVKKHFEPMWANELFASCSPEERVLLDEVIREALRS